MAEIEKSSLDNSFEKRKKETTTEEIEDKNSSLTGSKERAKIEPIVEKSDVMVERKGLGEKVKKSFISESMRDVLEFGLYDLVIPGIKDAFFALLERLFYGGESYRSGRYRNRDSKPRTNYSSYYKSSIRDYDDDDDYYYRRKKRSSRDRDRDRDEDDDIDEGINYRRIIIKGRDPIKNKGKAEEVVYELRKCIRDYGSTSKADLFNAVSLPSSYKDYDWGWREEDDIDYKRIRNGWYLICVPEAEFLGD